MAKGDKCIVSNCRNIITYKGRVCGTHKWRQTHHKSYDLPTHIGDPSYLIEEKLPDGFVKQCDKHGLLTLDNCYPKYYKQKVASYNCKPCMLSDGIRNKYRGLKGLEDYDRMLKEQDGKCGMCKIPENNTSRNGKVKRFNIDHCHETGEVRGLLCSFCNSILGYARDDVNILKDGIIYLEKKRTKHEPTSTTLPKNELSPS
jgi:hypothetical protein